MFTLFDVGANWGTDSLEITQKDNNYHTWAFEPTPELIANLSIKSQEFSNRYTVVPMAVSNFNGIAQFNVARHGDWGVSSLLDFSDGLENTWRKRKDLYVDQKISVHVIRLDTWFDLFNPPITQIDFFHCDTQGSDLKVLEGMGKYFSLIKDGVIECPQSEEVKLYKGQHTKEEAYKFLDDRGYMVYKVESQLNEDNLFFRPK